MRVCVSRGRGCDRREETEKVKHRRETCIYTGQSNDRVDNMMTMGQIGQHNLGEICKAMPLQR